MCTPHYSTYSWIYEESRRTKEGGQHTLPPSRGINTDYSILRRPFSICSRNHPHSPHCQKLTPTVYLVSAVEICWIVPISGFKKPTLIQCALIAIASFLFIIIPLFYSSLKTVVEI